MKKLMFLGGSDIQVSGIEFAKSLGYYVITCDYLPDNPGHKISNKYYNVSTTDLEGVLEIARKENIDGITAYASDPAALTASYVSEKMGLRGVPFESAKILSNKDDFRVFMEENGFKHPNFKKVTSVQDVKDFVEKHGKSIIKPVDSSGSKGITIIESNSDIESIYKDSIQYTRNGRLVIEKFIEKLGDQICGDVVVLEGKLIFTGHGNVHFDEVCDPVTPCSITLPYNNDSTKVAELNNVLQDIFTKLNIEHGTFNIDAMIDSNGDVYVIEIGARNGGNLFTELIKKNSGFDIVKVTLVSAIENLTIKDLGEGYSSDEISPYCSHYVLHSKYDGVLEDIEFTEEITDNIFYRNVKVNKGDEVFKFTGSNKRMGLCLLEYDSYDDMIKKVSNFDKYVKIKLK
jgi:carbamoylphosphate synthase large subunit